MLILLLPLLLLLLLVLLIKLRYAFLARLSVNPSPEEEFQVLDQGSQVPVGDLHLPQDLRELHCSPERDTESARGRVRVRARGDGGRYGPKRRRRWCAPYR